LKTDANERSLSHHLANCLSQHFPGWDIDCEYNRDGFDNAKALNLPPRTQPTSNDADTRTVFPDIIVHRRGQSGSANNLLVVEVKKSSNRDEEEYVYDRVKLRQFQTQLGYQHAYLVKLDTDHSPPAGNRIERISLDYDPIIAAKTDCGQAALNGWDQGDGSHAMPF